MQNNVDEKLKADGKLRSSTEIQLKEKEDDLVLAAKLGQTLLEQNEELTSENNRLLKKIEVKLNIVHLMNFYLYQFRLYSKKTLFLEEIFKLWKIAIIPSLRISNRKY